MILIARQSGLTLNVRIDAGQSNSIYLKRQNLSNADHDAEKPPSV